MENVTIWGWDLTYSSNKQRFLEMVSRHFGSVASSTVRNFGVERLPLVILIAKLRGNMEIFQVGTVNHACLLSTTIVLILRLFMEMSH